MIGLEDGFRRFQDFGLILGLAIVITIIGSMLRFAFVVGQQQLPVMCYSTLHTSLILSDCDTVFAEIHQFWAMLAVQIASSYWAY
jgi:hypothetical protein